MCGWGIRCWAARVTRAGGPHRLLGTKKDRARVIHSARCWAPQTCVRTHTDGRLALCGKVRTAMSFPPFRLPLVLLLGACGSGSTPGATSDTDTSSGGESGGQWHWHEHGRRQRQRRRKRHGHRPGDTPFAGGSRLRAVVEVNAEGDAVLKHWRDTELEIDCEMIVTAPGQGHCLPLGGQIPADLSGFVAATGELETIAGGLGRITLIGEDGSWEWIGPYDIGRDALCRVEELTNATGCAPLERASLDDRVFLDADCALNAAYNLEQGDEPIPEVVLRGVQILQVGDRVPVEELWTGKPGRLPPPLRKTHRRSTCMTYFPRPQWTSRRRTPPPPVRAGCVRASLRRRVWPWPPRRRSGLTKSCSHPASWFLRRTAAMSAHRAASGPDGFFRGRHVPGPPPGNG